MVLDLFKAAVRAADSLDASDSFACIHCACTGMFELHCAWVWGANRYCTSLSLSCKLISFPPLFVGLIPRIYSLRALSLNGSSNLDHLLHSLEWLLGCQIGGSRQLSNSLPFSATLRMVKKSTTNVRTKDNGSISRVLRGKMPEVARAEAMARTKMALELIYTVGTTLEGILPQNSTGDTWHSLAHSTPHSLLPVTMKWGGPSWNNHTSSIFPNFHCIPVVPALSCPVANEVPWSKSINDLVSGKSTLQNEILRWSGSLSKYTSSLISHMVGGEMPGGFNITSIKGHLLKMCGLGPGHFDNVLLLGTTMELEGKAWLYAIVAAHT